jgi:FMN phosphatase YigB (HAD superfamily)
MLDVDNTLLDNDALKEYLAAELRALLGDGGAARFWELYEEVRREQDVVDLPLTAQRYGEDAGDPAKTATITQLLETIPFRRFLYPHSLETLHYLDTLGTVGILSDGDQVFQFQKIERSGLADAVDGCVLIYKHKEQHLDEVAKCQPSDHAVLIDDKARILHDVKTILGPRVTTVHVQQGHYAREPLPPGFTPDVSVPAIGDLRALPAARFWRSEADPS